MKRTSCAWAMGLSHLANAAQYPRLPFDDNTIRTCSYWYDNKHNLSCQQVRDEDWQVSPADFHRWNPTISETCDGWTAGHSYCVAVVSERSSSSSIASSTEFTTTTTTAVTTTTPVYSAVWTGRGCYADADLHPFQTQFPSPSGNDLTQHKCEDACWKASYPFVGLKAGVECWCGKYVNGNLTDAQDECNIPCPGNRSETCGGDNAFNVLEGNKAARVFTTTPVLDSPTYTTEADSSGEFPSGVDPSDVFGTQAPNTASAGPSETSKSSAVNRFSVSYPVMALIGGLGLVLAH